MERNEMIKVLMEKAKVTEQEAYEALENNNWDLLDSIIYLERMGKVENNQSTAIVEVEVEDTKKKNKSKEDNYGGVAAIIGRIFRFIGKVLRKGNNNYFEVKKENEKPIKVSLTISALLLIFLTPLVVVLLIIGLFCGYKYSISGKDINCHGVNDIFDGVAKSADSIKRDFKEGYEK